MNPYEAPQEPAPREPQSRQLGENGGCATAFAVLMSLGLFLSGCGMYAERNTGPREAYIFEMYRNATGFFGVLSLISYLLLYYYRTRDR